MDEEFNVAITRYDSFFFLTVGVDTLSGPKEIRGKWLPGVPIGTPKNSDSLRTHDFPQPLSPCPIP